MNEGKEDRCDERDEQRKVVVNPKFQSPLFIHYVIEIRSKKGQMVHRTCQQETRFDELRKPIVNPMSRNPLSLYAKPSRSGQRRSEGESYVPGRSKIS